MRAKSIFFVISMFIVVSCDQHVCSPSSNTPECLDQTIIDFENNFSNCSGKTISKYRFQEQDVFVFYPGDCVATDASSTVYTSYCEKLGSIGGWSGNLINGVDFYENAIFIEEVWKD